MNILLSPDQINQLLQLVREAGSAILAIYQQRDSYQIQHKSDASPLTAADLAAQQLISRRLPLIVDLPQVSEESRLTRFSERKSWSCYWLVDPLDGTKEFIAGSGEFTVNIALIRDHRPVLGVVYAPVLDTCYLGVLEAESPASLGAWKSVAAGPLAPIACAPLDDRLAQGLPLRVLFSHRHGTNATQALVARLRHAWPSGMEEAGAGSSLKFCVIAEGRADFYPRLAPTCEWDTGAAQAVLEAAGGAVVKAWEQPEGEAPDAALQSLDYNLQDEPINPFFYALGDSRFNWRQLLQGAEQAD